MTETPNSERVSTRLQRIAKLALEAPERAFLSLAHHIDKEFLGEAFRRTRKDGATGVDGESGREYEGTLEANLQSLLDRFKSGRYRAPPVRRTYVPKGDGKTRPIGIPTFEDKVLQRAVVMVLEAVYEQDFLSCSHGYRPGRSAHGALAALQWDLMAMGGGWVIEAGARRCAASDDRQVAGRRCAWRGRYCLTRTPVLRRGESSPRFWRTSIYMKSWTGGLSGT